MKKTLLKGLGIAVGAVMPMLIATPVMAWGPERKLYTMADPAEQPVFNSIKDNPAVGDERDFVRIVEVGAGAAYSSDIKVEPGKQYEVWIYYHNDASSTFNDAAHGMVGVAANTRVSSFFPLSLNKGEMGKVTGTISATNAVPTAVWDEAYITATEAMTLHYVTGSAKIYNKYPVNGSVLSTSLFSDTGTFIGLNNLDGVILGCEEYSGQVVYKIQTEALGGGGGSSEPGVENTPSLPKELPTTGPAEVFLAVALVLVVTAGVVYFVKSHSAVKKVAKKAKGRK